MLCLASLICLSAELLKTLYIVHEVLKPWDKKQSIRLCRNFYPPYVSMAGTKFAVFSLSGLTVSGYRYLHDGGTDQREIFHDGTYQSRYFQQR